MGNFYTNVVLRESDTDRVASAMQSLGRRAYVATLGTTTVVFDEQCENQDLQQLQRLAGELSGRVGCAAFAVCNHDDDVFWYALAENGSVVDTYESKPGYFDSQPEAPKGGDAASLCAAFGVPGRQAAVAEVLHGKSDFMFEIDRHRRLLELLELPVELGVLGYTYAEGELTRIAGVNAVHSLGGARPLEREAADASTAPPSIDPQLQAAMKAEGADLMTYSMALAFNRVEIPDAFAAVAGSGIASGYVVLMRLQRYVVDHQLGSPGGLVRANDALATALGEREFTMLALPRLVVRALGIKPLTPEETAALRRGDPEIQRRFADALRESAMEML